jgi:hypothetical protein
VTLNKRVKAHSIGSPNTKNLKLKKKEEKKKNRRLLNRGSDHVPREGPGVGTRAVTLG